jgi:hypothetical protein
MLLYTLLCHLQKLYFRQPMKKYVYSIVFFALFAFSAFTGHAQEFRKVEGTPTATSDSAKTKDPKKAALYSTIFPGMGQFYNEKYWKMPIVYGSFIGLGYFGGYNWGQYKEYKSAYLFKIDNDSSTIDPFPNVSPQAVQSQYQAFRKNFELSIIGMLVIYGLNVVDAAVDAHLYSFDVSENLSLRWQPQIMPAWHQSGTASFTMHIQLQWKKP